MNINNVVIVCCRRTGSSVTLESLRGQYGLNDMVEYFTDKIDRTVDDFNRDIKLYEKNIVKFIINHPKMTFELFNQIKDNFDLVIFSERIDVAEMIVSDLIGAKTGGLRNDISPQNFFNEEMILEDIRYYYEYLKIKNSFDNPNVVTYENIHEDLKKVFGQEVDFSYSTKKKLFTKDHKRTTVLDYDKIEEYVKVNLGV